MAGVKINTIKKPQTQKWMFKCQPYQFSNTSEKHFSATLPVPCTKVFLFLTATIKNCRVGKRQGSLYDYISQKFLSCF